ncbi:MAG TPA: CHASE domain-containing protein, partial [Gemmatimonadaceae bacterium]|nr:CHASE domain-containing protein [Gemmatimonadaceae bacterium]
WVILGATLLLAAGAAVFVWRLRETVMQVRFDNAVEAATDRITGRLDIYTTILRSGAGLFGASGFVSREEFRAFARTVEVQSRFPGVQGIGWSERLTYDSARVPDETQAIRYLEPMDDRNRAALGYDMYADSTRRAAMARARDTGTPAMSGRVTLVQEIRGPRQVGFLLYVPVYAGADIMPATIEERRRLLRGFVYAPFRANDLFAGIFGTEREPRVSFSVYDGPRLDTAQRLYRSAAASRGSLSQLARLDVAGRPWTVEFHAMPALEQGVAANVFRIVVVGGLLVTAVIGWLAFAQARARAEAESASRAKSDFLAVMSHELRTPLNAIGGYVELLEMELYGPVSGDQRQTLGRVKRARDHLLGLINNLLDYARLEAGQEEFRLASVNVESLLDTVSELIAPQVHAGQLTFRREPGDAGVYIVTDSEKVQQVLLNLLSNAVKFTEPGGTVTLGWEHTQRDVLITVHDTGIGIAPDKLERIFDPFVQVESPLTRGRSGTGLGLAIVRDISTALGGEVTATSRTGEGSTFVVRLPRAARPSGGSRAVETAQRAG